MTEGEDTKDFRSHHLSLTQADLRRFELILAEWSAKGIDWELDQSTSEVGYVTLIVESLASVEGSYALIEFHKIKGKKIISWQATRWVARFFSCQTKLGDNREMKVSIGASSLIAALKYACNEIAHGVIAYSKLEQYYLR